MLLGGVDFKSPDREKLVRTDFMKDAEFATEAEEKNAALGAATRTPDQHGEAKRMNTQYQD